MLYFYYINKHTIIVYGLVHAWVACAYILYKAKISTNYKTRSLLFIYPSYNNGNCYIASAETKRDWLIHGHVALDKCNVSLGQQVNNCCPLRPAPYINKQNGGETRKFINSDFRAFCLKKYTNRQGGYASETKI